MSRWHMATADSVALIGALIAHVSLIGAAGLLPPVSELLGSVRPSSAAGLELVDVERLPDEKLLDEKPSPELVKSLVDEPPALEEAHRAEAPTLRGARTVDPAAISGTPGKLAASPAETHAGATNEKPGPVGAAGNAGPAAESKPSSPDEYDRPAEPAAPTRLSGMLGAPAWSVPGAIARDVAAPAPTTSPERAPLDPTIASRVIASTLRSRDKKKGVDVPGASVVAGTVATAMRSVAVPHNTRATFEVKLGPGGKLLGARVVSSSGGDAAQWDAAAKSVAASLAKQNLPLGPDADKTGVTVKVTVTQKHVFPSGTAKGADIKPKCANGFINEIIDAADDKPMRPVDPKVPMFQDEHGRPCIPVGIDGVSDVSNWGAQKQIQVESSFQVIIPGQLDLPADVVPVNTDAPWIERGKEGPRPTLPQKVRKQLRDREKKK